MRDGHYRVFFSAPQGTVGDGLVKIDRGVIHGADAGFMYTGRLEETGEGIRGEVHVRRHTASNIRSVLGLPENYRIEFAGVSKEDAFQVMGNVAGQPALRIGIMGWLQE